MYPRLLEGDLLLVRRTAHAPEGPGGAGPGGPPLVRTVSGGTLLPANPEYPPRPLDSRVRILGRALTLIRNL